MKQRKNTSFLILIFMTIIHLFTPNIYPAEEINNIIFYIGDGMGATQVLTARIALMGADKRFVIEKMPVTGLITTHAVDNLITDSAAGATAMATGVKTRNGMVGVTPDSTVLLTVMEAAMARGIAAGLVATSTITHATPASFASHVPSRRNQAEIAKQLIHSGLNIIFGGGKSYFIPSTESGSKRTDDQNLIEEGREHGFRYVSTATELSRIASSKVLGLFAMDAMGREPDEPTLEQMSRKAIEILSKQPNGFFLIIEGSQIDWAGHDNDFQYLIREMKAFDDAVKVGLDFAKENENTLVVVTADHETGGLLLMGGTVDGKDIEVDWGTNYHTGQMVPVFASGKGSWMFSGINDNSVFAKNFARFLGIHDFPGLHTNIYE